MTTTRNWTIRDTHDNGRVIRTNMTRKGAYRLADKLDTEYGAVRYVAAPIPGTERVQS